MKTNNTGLRQPADPHLRTLIWKLKGIIKSIHHLQNVSLKHNTAQTKTITNMVQTLMEFIKPAFPSKVLWTLL